MIVLSIYGDTRKYIHGDRGYIHDGGASLWIDGYHKNTISQERLSGIKHDGAYPEACIRYLLKENNIKKQDVDIIAIPSNYSQVSVELRLTKKLEESLAEEYPNAKVEYLEHHAAHAAAGIFSNDMNEGHFLSIDGSGQNFFDAIHLLPDGSTKIISKPKELGWAPIPFMEHYTWGYFNKSNKTFHNVHAMDGTNNLGHFYQAFSRKVVYLKNNKAVDLMEKDDKTPLSFEKHRIKMEEILKELSGENTRNKERYEFSLASPGKAMCLGAYVDSFMKWKDRYRLFYTNEELFFDNSIPYVIFSRWDPKKHNENLAQYDYLYNMSPEVNAWIMQKNFEEAMMYIIKGMKNKNIFGDNLVLSGGVFLNILYNQKLRKENIFKNLHITPFCSDAGIAFGAAAFSMWKNFGKAEMKEKNICLLGKKYSDNEIKSVLDRYDHKFKITEYNNFNELCDVTAEKIKNNQIVGWFQGKSEHGPRALGSRSILMNPTPANNKDILNEKVKHRENYRPFAGIILREYMSEYFDEDWDTPYMMYSCNVKEDKIKDIAAITHVDNTCRIQTVDDEMNPEMTMLLKSLDKITGIPIVLNTSFNDNGLPIVETPEDALNAFSKLELDLLVIGNYIVEK
jgi:carbamoyltransferase